MVTALLSMGRVGLVVIWAKPNVQVARTKRMIEIFRNIRKLIILVRNEKAYPVMPTG
jgi:hypothetical protein